MSKSRLSQNIFKVYKYIFFLKERVYDIVNIPLKYISFFSLEIGKILCHFQMWWGRSIVFQRSVMACIFSFPSFNAVFGWLIVSVQILKQKYINMKRKLK